MTELTDLQQLQKLYAYHGYPSATEFKSIAKKAGFDKTLISDFIAGSASTSIYKRRKVTRGHYSHSQYRYCFMIDLMDVSKYAAHNRGIHWLLNIVEWHSGKVWSIPLKTKNAKPIADAVQAIIESLKNHLAIPLRIVSDRGTEFNLLKKYVDSTHPNLSWLYTTDTRKSTRPVERFNRTVWTAIARYWARPDNTGKNKFEFVSFLPGMISRYNQRIHPRTKQTPDGAYADGFESYIPLGDLATGNIDLVLPINVGDSVRIYNPIATFDKKSVTPTYGDKVFTVTKISNYKYTLDGHPKKFEAHELMKVPPLQNPRILLTTAAAQLKSAAKSARQRKEMFTRSDFKVGIASEDGGRGRRDTSKATMRLKMLR